MMDGVCDACRDYMAQGHGEREALGCLLFHRSRDPGSPCHCRCVSRVSRPEAVSLAASLGHIHCINKLVQTGADVNEPGAPESPTGADVNSAESPRADVNSPEGPVADIHEVNECGSCARELGTTAKGAGVNKVEQLVTKSQTQLHSNDNDEPETRESELIGANEGLNLSIQTGAILNKLMDTAVNTPVQDGGDVNRLRQKEGDVNESSEVATGDNYHANRNTSTEIQDNTNMTKPAGGYVNIELLYVRCKDNGARVNKEDNLIHTDVRRCKQDGTGVSRDDNLVHSALVSAVEHNQCDCTKMLVEAGADVNARKSLVLAEAARTGHDKCLEILLNKATMKVEIDACDTNKPSALMWAAGKGHLTCAELLVKSGADVNQTLIDAVKKGDFHVAERLFILGAGENLRKLVGKKFFEYLMRNGCYRCLERLLNKEKIDIRDVFRTLLMCSTEKRNLKCVEPLVEAGADVNTRLDKGYTALMLAAKQGNQKCVQYLISKGANVNVVDNKHFETPLLKASFNLHYDCARLLLLAGARVNMGSSKNETRFRTTVNKTMVLLLHAAGEILIIDDSIVRRFAAGDIYSDSNKLRLKHQCRRTIRYQMLAVDLYGNLILRVQQTRTSQTTGVLHAV